MKAMTPVPASTAKVLWKPVAARRKPHSVVPTIWPRFVAALRRPSCTPRAPGRLARHRPVRRPERGAREDEYKLAGEQHPEAVRHHEPQAGGESGYAGAEQDAAPANAVRIGAADEVERLRHHGEREQNADFRHSTAPANTRRAEPPARSFPGRSSRRARRGKEGMRQQRAIIGWLLPHGAVVRGGRAAGRVHCRSGADTACLSSSICRRAAPTAPGPSAGWRALARLRWRFPLALALSTFQESSRAPEDGAHEALRSGSGPGVSALGQTGL